jgi:hypothetical protein
MSPFEDDVRARTEAPHDHADDDVRRRERIDWENREPVCFAVQTAVAAIEDSDPLDLPPLAEAVDPDALDRLFDPDAPNIASRHLEFAYAGYRIHVYGRGEVVVTDE